MRISGQSLISVRSFNVQFKPTVFLLDWKTIWWFFLLNNRVLQKKVMYYYWRLGRFISFPPFIPLSPSKGEVKLLPFHFPYNFRNLADPAYFICTGKVNWIYWSLFQIRSFGELWNEPFNLIKLFSRMNKKTYGCNFLFVIGVTARETYVLGEFDVTRIKITKIYFKPLFSNS